MSMLESLGEMGRLLIAVLKLLLGSANFFLRRTELASRIFAWAFVALLI
jgi:hypothetical protein